MPRFDRLSFSKDWRNPKDFATYEGEETKVREDMQFLFNEIRDFLNGLIGGIETMAVPGTGDFKADGSVRALGDFLLGAYRLTEVGAPTEETDAANKKYVDDTVKAAAEERVLQTSFDAHLADVNNPHSVTAPQVTITEELATRLGLPALSTVETAIATMGDSVNGMLDAVAGVPDKAQWQMYRWSALYKTVNLSFISWGNAVPELSLRVSDTIIFAEDGTVSLGEYTEVTETSELPDVGKYFQITAQTVGYPDSSIVYQVTETSTRETTRYSSGDGCTLYWNALQQVVPYEEYLGRVTSEDEEAYPEDGYVDGVRYVREARLSTKIAQIQSGDYTGTGKYGESNPTLLEFNFIPAVCAVFDAAGVLQQLACANALTTEYAQLGSSGVYAKKSEDGKTISLYHASDSAKQFNTLSAKYHFVGIG